MEKKKDNGKKWWLYGALVSFLVAVTGVILMLFVFDGKKSRSIDDDDEDEDGVEWFDEKKTPDKESQQPTDVKPIKEEFSDQTVYDIVDQMPEFPEGDATVWIANNIRFPSDLETDAQSVVVCQFVVEKDGSIRNVTVLRSIHPSLDKEAVRVIESMPNWIPGRKDGQPVRVKYTLPVKFQLQ